MPNPSKLPNPLPAPLPNFDGGVPQLTAAGAIENSPAFRHAASLAYDEALARGAAGIPYEGAFLVTDQGHPSKITFSQSQGGDAAATRQTVYADDIAAVHTHPDAAEYNQEPSPTDIAVAKRVKRPIMVLSREGLFEVDAQGNVRQVFKGTKWLSSKFKPTQ